MSWIWLTEWLTDITQGVRHWLLWPCFSLKSGFTKIWCTPNIPLLSLLLPLQFVFFSFFTMSFFFVTIWVEFCHILIFFSFVIIWVFESYHSVCTIWVFSFVTIWFEFCHNLIFWVLSQFEFLSFVTIWVAFCHNMSFQVLSQLVHNLSFWVLS